MACLAGLGGRKVAMGITGSLATAVRIGEPGTLSLGINLQVAGLGGRTSALGFKGRVATARG
jgi:hypothetical protein